MISARTYDRRWWLTRGALVALLVVCSGALLVRAIFFAEAAPPPPEKITEVEAKHVRNGHTVKLDNDEKLIYAGIRAPYEQEPLFEESKRRNIELVEGKLLRLRYDGQVERDGDGRLVAYAFLDDVLVNETLVREGLAYVRLTPDSQRYAERLLAAQVEARRKKVGVWRQPLATPEASYPADPKYGNFHRPTCPEASKTKPERLVVCKTRAEALDRGCAPCTKCHP